MENRRYSLVCLLISMIPMSACGQSTTIDLTSVRVRVEGTVRDGAGSPVAGATVRATYYDARAGGRIFLGTDVDITDSNGTYAVTPTVAMVPFDGIVDVKAIPGPGSTLSSDSVIGVTVHFDSTAAPSDTAVVNLVLQ